MLKAISQTNMPFFKKQNNQLVNYSEPSTAEGVAYDNTDSGLTANNIQDAIDEVVVGIEGKPDHFYATKEDMLDDIANIGEGEMAYTEEDASDLLTRVENIEQDVSDAQEDIVQLNSDLTNIYDSSLVSGSYNVSILFGSRISGLGAPSYNIPHFLKRKDVTITGVSGTNLINTYASTDSGEATHFPIRGDKLLCIYLNSSGNVCVPVTFNYTVS